MVESIVQAKMKSLQMERTHGTNRVAFTWIVISQAGDLDWYLIRMNGKKLAGTKIIQYLISSRDLVYPVSNLSISLC